MIERQTDWKYRQAPESFSRVNRDAIGVEPAITRILPFQFLLQVRRGRGGKLRRDRVMGERRDRQVVEIILEIQAID